MRPGQISKRSRGRGRKPSVQINRTFDSNGPDVKIRGSASQIVDKYQALARDAQSSGDHVQAENYLQHAEHYLRVLNAMQQSMQSTYQGERPQPRPNGSWNGEAANGSAHAPAQGEGQPAAAAESEAGQPGDGEVANFG